MYQLWIVSLFPGMGPVWPPFLISLHNKKEEIKGGIRDCPALWPVLEANSGKSVEGKGGSVAGFPTIHSPRILTLEVLKQLNVLHLLYGLISREIKKGHKRYCKVCCRSK